MQRLTSPDQSGYDRLGFPRQWRVGVASATGTMSLVMSTAARRHHCPPNVTTSTARHPSPQPGVPVLTSLYIDESVTETFWSRRDFSCASVRILWVTRGVIRRIRVEYPHRRPRGGRVTCGYCARRFESAQFGVLQRQPSSLQRKAARDPTGPRGFPASWAQIGRQRRSRACLRSMRATAPQARKTNAKVLKVWVNSALGPIRTFPHTAARATPRSRNANTAP